LRLACARPAVRPGFEGDLVIYGFNSPLTLCLLLLSAWCGVGIAGLLRPKSIAFVGRTLFPLGALFGAALAVVAFAGVKYPVEQLVLPIGLACSSAPRRSLRRIFDFARRRIDRHFNFCSRLLPAG
jgi:hypothetical protein